MAETQRNKSTNSIISGTSKELTPASYIDRVSGVREHVYVRVILMEVVGLLASNQNPLQRCPKMR